MRSGAKVAVIGGVFVLMAGGIGYGAYSMLGDTVGGDGGTRSASESSKVKTGPPSAEEIAETSKGFLDAWAAGDAAAASLLTNNESGSEPVLSSYGEDARIGKVKITPGPAVGTKVPYTVKATVSYDGKSKPLAYASELTVVRGLTTGKALVDWAPTVVHPQLTEGATLRTGEASTATIEAVDHNGKVLTKEKYPSLGPILDTLREKYGESAGGSPGIETWIEPADETQPDVNLLTLAKGKPGKVQTTIDAGAQEAAERAVKKYAQASVVAVKPSTGAIRAVANNPATGFNTAMQGKQAPGSTLKIMTAAMLLEKGLVTANGAAECPKEARYYTRTIHNLDRFSLPDGSTFTQSFARSCNTAFVKLIDDVDDDSALAKEAREVFGIGLDWKSGVVTTDGSVPEEVQGEAAAQYIGQGTVQMNALNMASITATARTGTFRQPVIVPQSLDNRQLATATRSLSPSVTQQLTTMMRATAAWGTGAKAMASVGGDKGAKTGSAEVDGQDTSNSWFTGFSDDLAAAAVVQTGGHGGDAAGPVVAEVLRAGG
ncbi:penicillin-binding transpeptidase domain-containing protein [Streptomyces anulatus]|uniref:Penicillin-binding transpeptidase domain-containing protein n=1 Tax=Streptomyces anulatus TaxID=1892 RepID=A0ABZ1ZK24_STRAQ|nr:penicillin-binding transpeptidase domain-containing protein [Streptomyces anulatus]WST85784.1 penicillin-binding transpeptidase domain-containing protein [Streptomyces anulatus]WSU29544.1 penicillin-binding transpeptidase domain-containing protein [Streptomyces anulatus]WSU91582.1 penicillin-binding transpeptidase domain-containing protein [Streptomyces anulatus]